MTLVSFHPIITGDVNRICAGRLPDETDRRIMATATAIILPQGCSPALHAMAMETGRPVFPDYSARFAYPGKIGQIRLFRQHGARIPESIVFNDRRADANVLTRHSPDPPLPLPFVLKTNWGGESAGVHWIDSLDAFANRLDITDQGEGLLLQEWIPHRHRTLRVVVIGERMFSYWRVQPDSGVFGEALRLGSRIDPAADPDLQAVGKRRVSAFCQACGINLAGVDLIFSEVSCEPFFLEINYFFGRTGLGGSFAYYQILESEVRKWVAGMATAS